jgi:integrase
MDWYLDDVRPSFLCSTTNDPTLLFLSERGGPICTEQVRRVLGRIATNAGIPARVTPHILRHTYGTQMAAVMGPEALQRQLGHENLTTTLGTYYHQNPEHVGNEIEIGVTNLTNAINAMTEGLYDADHD